MADTGYKSPGTVINDSTPGTHNWLDPNEAKTSDNVYAYVVGGLPGGISHYLKCTNFSMGVPAEATINGIKVEIERYPSTASAVSDYRVRIVKNNVVQSHDHKKAGFWPTSQTYYVYGGSSDLWNVTWSAAQINSSFFGVALSVDVEEDRKRAFVDHVRIKVYYTEPSTNMKINIGDSWKDADEIKINIGDSWKTVSEIWINIGDVWKQVF